MPANGISLTTWLLAPLHLYALRDQRIPNGPKGPAESTPPATLTARGALECNGVKRTAPHGTRDLGNLTSRGPQTCLAFPMSHALEGTTQEHSVALASLALRSHPATTKPVFLKSVLGDLPECGADTRLIPRDAG